MSFFFSLSGGLLIPLSISDLRFFSIPFSIEENVLNPLLTRMELSIAPSKNTMTKIFESTQENFRNLIRIIFFPPTMDCGDSSLGIPQAGTPNVLLTKVLFLEIQS